MQVLRISLFFLYNFYEWSRVMRKNIIKITLEKDVYQYTIEVNKDIEKLDLKAIAKDKNAKVEISDQNLENDIKEQDYELVDILVYSRYESIIFYYYILFN